MKEIYSASLADGLAAEDFIATIKQLEKQAGLEVKAASTET